MDETRERILNCAGEVFADKGFEAATVREICAKAGANIAAVNYHFRSKEGLYIEAVQAAHCAQDDFGFSDEAKSLPRERKLGLFVRGMMEHMWDHERPDWQLQIVMREMTRPTEACVELVRNFIGPKFELLHGILREFLPDATDRELNLAAFSVVGQCLLYRFHRPIGRLLVGEQEYSSYTVEEIAEHITRFCIHGLLGRGREPKP
jgi:AcrR family transcriptional regulator